MRLDKESDCAGGGEEEGKICWQRASSMRLTMEMNEVSHSVLYLEISGLGLALSVEVGRFVSPGFRGGRARARARARASRWKLELEPDLRQETIPGVWRRRCRAPRPGPAL